MSPARIPLAHADFSKWSKHLETNARHKDIYFDIYDTEAERSAKSRASDGKLDLSEAGLPSLDCEATHSTGNLGSLFVPIRRFRCTIPMTVKRRRSVAHFRVRCFAAKYAQTCSGRAGRDESLRLSQNILKSVQSALYARFVFSGIDSRATFCASAMRSSMGTRSA